MLIYIIFVWYHSPVYQIIGMNIMNILSLLYTGLSEPFLNRKKRRMEFFNESCLGVISYFLFLYTDFIPDEDLKYNLAWVQVFIFGLNVAVNCADVFKGMAKDTFLMVKKRYVKIKSSIPSK